MVVGAVVMGAVVMGAVMKGENWVLEECVVTLSRN